ncbi:MAG: hypothetical protein RL527_270 [Planctomycetota bacterium]
MLKARTIVSTICSLGLAAAAHAQAPIGWQVAAQSIDAPATGETWGYSIAFNEDASLLAVGAPNARVLGGSGVGKVYIYERLVDGTGAVSWNLAQTIPAPPFVTTDPDDPYVVVGFAQFGCSVALENDTLVVGSWGWTAQGETTTFSGRAFVYSRVSGTFGTVDADNPDGNSYTLPTATLRPDDRAALDLFGYEVAIDFEGANGTIVVGKQLGEGPAAESNAGSAYVFEGSGSTWTQVAKLTTGDAAAANDNFGEQIAVRDGTVVVGCPKHDGPTGSTNSGTVFVFERPGAFGTWVASTEPTTSIRAADGSSNDAFGASVDVLKDGGGTLIAIGAPGYDRDLAGDSFNGNGAAYVYTGSGTTWSLAERAFARESNPNNAFGFSVAAAGSVNQPSLIVGSPGYEGGAVGSGTGFNVLGSGGAYSLAGSDLWVPDSAANGALGRSTAHRRVIGADVVIRAALGSEYPTLAPRIFVWDFSTSVPGPDYPTDKQIAAGVPPEPVAPGADGFPDDATGGQPAGGGVPSGGVGGGTTVVIPLTPIQADFGLVIGTVMVTNGKQLLGFQTDGRNARSKSEAQPIGTIPSGWVYLAAPDINGDRGGDPLFIDTTTNKVRAWLRDGLTVTGQREVGNWNSNLRYLTFGKLNDDQTDDIVWQDGDEAVVWFIADGAIENEARIPLEGADPLDPSTLSAWEATVTDIDTDNAFELVLRKAGVGTFLYRVSDDGTEPVAQELPDQGPGFTLLGSADMDGENASDLVWHDLSRDAPYFSYLRVTQDNLGNEIIIEDGGREWPLSFGGITPVEVRDLDSNGTGDFILQIGSDAIIFLTEIKSTDSGFSYLGTAYRRNLGEVPGGGTVRGFGVR